MEDARKAVEHGVSGILVSNHGGRTLDGLPATVSPILTYIKVLACVFVFQNMIFLNITTDLHLVRHTIVGKITDY